MIAQNTSRKSAKKVQLLRTHVPVTLYSTPAKQIPLLLTAAFFAG